MLSRPARYVLVVGQRRPAGAGAGDGEGRAEREAGLDCGMRLVKSTKVREGGGQPKKWLADNFGWPRSTVRNHPTACSQIPRWSLRQARGEPIQT